MGGSIKKHLEHQPTVSLKQMLESFSGKDMIEEYGYAIRYIKDELEKRED